MRLTKKIRINPSAKMRAALYNVSRQCAFVWNTALEERLKNPALDVYTQKRQLTMLKKEYPELKKPCSQVLQNVVFSLDQSFTMVKTKQKRGDKKAHLPRPKHPEKFFTQEYSQKGISFKIHEQDEKTYLSLAYGSKPKDWLSIEIDAGDYERAKTVLICYQNKKWYACITFSIDLPKRKEQGHALYIDPGCRMALTAVKTTGEFFEYDLRPLYEINRDTYKRIDSLISQRDLKKKGSCHYRRLNQQIKDLRSKIRTRTKQYLHVLSKKILDDHPDVVDIYIGDWKKKDTLAQTGKKYVDRRINRAVQNNHPLEKLISNLSYKALLRGQEVKRIDERGTTRSCSACCYVIEESIKPTVRIFNCPNCQFTYPRDHNSCLNLLKKNDSALWKSLSGNLSDRSIRTGFHPFLFKPLYSIQAIATS